MHRTIRQDLAELAGFLSQAGVCGKWNALDSSAALGMTCTQLYLKFAFYLPLSAPSGEKGLWNGPARRQRELDSLDSDGTYVSIGVLRSWEVPGCGAICGLRRDDPDLIRDLTGNRHLA